MKFNDVMIEASAYGVAVEVSQFGYLQFKPDGDAVVWMSHSTGKVWTAHDLEGHSFRGSKAATADWCLDRAVNGVR